jgi:hypothetical protein
MARLDEVRSGPVGSGRYGEARRGLVRCCGVSQGKAGGDRRGEFGSGPVG